MTRQFTAAAAFALCLATPALAFDPAAMSDAEKAAFNDAVRAYLMDNPQVIMDAVDGLEAQRAEQQASADGTLVATNLDALHGDGYSWVGGNPEGDVTVVEFMDYRCGYCRKAHDEVAELVGSDGNIRYIVKEFPILGEASMISSRFAIATRMIAGNDAYKAAHDALITLTADMSEPVLRRLSGTLGLDADAVLAKMDDPEVAREINETRALAQRLQINGTPTFVMGDELVRGYVPFATMQAIVTDQRADS
ncbi:DsbA family protein [Puniceibacterium sp. IMCC21224]|uniref:DsbA family protein n=1 Tax=Puniceibacterium sp. IMCC21224 TaxID=1618204 RepID=UPI00064E0C21|nr:DsbA family protein [Puniceibacterium sp. IMCC21224]KMK67520.1 protein-disulfide isomerase [Puniceibacterium sp. IMCC21224]